MRVRATISILVLAAAAAAVGVSAIASAHRAKALTSVKVRRCETGDDASTRTATFYGSMRALAHTRRMMMRFTLIDRSSDQPTVVDAPSLKAWRRSRRGVRKFGYAQKITGLERGHTYAARVHFRWIGRHGRRQATVTRRSADCREDGGLPNLAIKRVFARAGTASGTEMYSIVVVNRGAAAAHSVEVDLIVDSAAADSAEIATMEPGDTTTVEVSGPSCQARIRAVVDPHDEIFETTEDDNSRRQRCPDVAP